MLVCFLSILHMVCESKEVQLSKLVVLHRASILVHGSSSLYHPSQLYIVQVLLYAPHASPCHSAWAWRTWSVQKFAQLAGSYMQLRWQLCFCVLLLCSGIILNLWYSPSHDVCLCLALFPFRQYQLVERNNLSWYQGGPSLQEKWWS